ncbi:MAG TPA: respiratory nitrate reductase subunit gamma [Candidatus Saccharimonadales bacterium]|jgi:nitrate reductase gamma subunit|nr:respiratory nitrate reductase subunit gamma [Candidatus Saccharimonadales bacterium]
MTSSFLFSTFPYVAVALLIAGTLVRYILARREPEAMTAQAGEAVAALAGGKAWCLSLLALFLLHLAGLVFPRSILSWDSSTARLYLLEGAALVAGIVALVGWAAVMWQNLRRTGRSAVTELSDTVFLALLFIGIFSGLAIAVGERWGSMWGTITLTPYVLSLFRGNPAPTFIYGLPFLVRLHVFSAFAALAILPGTRLSSVLVLGLHRGLELFGRPFAAAERMAGDWVRKNNPAGRIWPEED